MATDGTSSFCVLMDDLPKPPIMLYSEKPARQAERTKKEPSFNTLCPSGFGTNIILGKKCTKFTNVQKSNKSACSLSLSLFNFNFKDWIYWRKTKKPQPKEWDFSSQDTSQGSTDYKSFPCSHSLVYSQEVIV